MTLIEPLSADERQALISAARSFLGAPFRHQGRTRKGMDCLGLIFLSFAAIGKPLQNRVDYGRAPGKDRAKLDRTLAAHFGTVSEPQPGDIVSIRWNADACHVGIITPHPERGIGLIHCYLWAGQVVEHGIDALWRGRIAGVYR